MSASTKGNIADILPLTPVQQGMLFHTLYAPEAGLYCDQLVCVLHCSPALDLDAFRHAWQAVAARHSILRTAFVWERQDAPLQVVLQKVTVPVEAMDWQGLDRETQEERLNALLQGDRGRGFDPSQPPLLRVTVVRLGTHDHRLVLEYHHMLMDAWSVPIVLGQLFTLYEARREGREPALPEARPFRDYVAWLRRRDPQRSEAFWRELLHGFDAPTPLGIERSSTEAAGRTPDLEQKDLRLSPPATAALVGFARSGRLTLSSLVHGAWSVLLSLYSGQEDVVFGTVVSGRPEELPGIESMVGSFINTLPVRVQVPRTAGVGRWLSVLHDRLVEIRRHELSALVEIQGWSEVPRGLPLFHSILAFENVPLDASLRELNGSVRLQGARYAARTNYPLTLTVTPGTELALRIFYDRNRLESLAVDRALGHLAALLEALPGIADGRLGDFPAMTQAERHQTVIEWNDTSVSYPLGLCLHERIEAQVERSPDAVAVLSDEERLTYRELDRRADRLARRLRALAVGPEVPVGVFAERSAGMVVGLLAVLKAGGAYAPLDPEYPDERLGFMLEGSRTPVVLTQTPLAERLGRLLRQGTSVVLLDDPADRRPDPAQGVPLRSGATPDNAAYVIHTSGSTGRPKGVVNTHRGIVNRLLWMQDRYGLGAGDRVLQKTPFSFDVSVWELFWPLLTGACLVMARPGGHRDGPYLVETIAAAGITTLHFVPSVLQVFLEEEGLERCSRLRRVICSGEALVPELAQRFFSRLGEPCGVELHNLYGPTEAAVDVTSWACTAGDARPTVAIGRPIANLHIVLLDPAGRPVPAGIQGELHIGGTGLARGYLHRPDLTAERFVPSPFADTFGGSGERLYRTGDLARFAAAGEIEFLGRIDHQVKIRGVRIELGEIESVLLRHPALRDAVVMACPGPAGHPRLVAYTVAAGEAEPGSAELREWAMASLPDTMVPALFVALPEMPLTASGKVDRRALPVPDATPADAAVFRRPRTPVEEVIAEIWAQVLGLEQVGIDEDFLAIGGHSLVATQIASRIRESLGVGLPLRELFQRPTVARLAALAEELLRDGAEAASPPIRPVPRGGELPLSYAQQRLWFLHRLDPQDPSYITPMVLRLAGRLDEPALEASLSSLLRRHESLRTIFREVDGKALQVVLAEPSPLCRIDLAGLPAGLRAAEASRFGGEEVRRPFDLASAPPIRATLLRLDEGEHLIFLTLHHIACDGWSLGILSRELVTAYQAFRDGRPSAFAQLPVQYADFAVWQRHHLAGNALDDLLGYWKRQLAGLSVLELPLDRPRVETSRPQGGTHRFTLPPPVLGPLRALGKQQGVTLFVLLLAAFKALLHARSGQADITVGTDFAGRNRTELEGLIGFFVNQIVLRTDLSGDPTGRQLLNRVREVMMGAYAHQDLPFDRLVEALRPDRNLALTPLFQAKLVLQNAPGAMPGLESLNATHVEIGGTSAKFDLLVNLREEGTELSGTFEYNRELFDPTTIERLAEDYQTVLQVLASDPDLRLGQIAQRLQEAQQQRRVRDEQELEEARLAKFQTVRRRAVHSLLRQDA